jgi:predicted membrane channel-forming protein YqfA (hemolysin III family)
MAKRWDMSLGVDWEKMGRNGLDRSELWVRAQKRNGVLWSLLLLGVVLYVVWRFELMKPFRPDNTALFWVSMVWFAGSAVETFNKRMGQCELRGEAPPYMEYRELHAPLFVIQYGLLAYLLYLDWRWAVTLYAVAGNAGQGAHVTVAEEAHRLRLIRVREWRSKDRMTAMGFARGFLARGGDMSARSPARFGIAALNLIGVGMLLYALYGRPPYSFFSILKLVVVAGCVLSAFYVFLRSPVLIVLSVALGICGWVELTGKYRRADWALPNWITACVLVLALVVAVWPLREPVEKRDAQRKSESG